METIIAAVIGVVGVLGAAYITRRTTSKIADSADKAQQNTDRLDDIEHAYRSVIATLSDNLAQAEARADELQRRLDERA